MTEGGFDSAKAKTGDVVNHVFSDEAWWAVGAQTRPGRFCPIMLRKWGGGGLEQARSLKYSRACAALQAGAICVGIGINLAILRKFWV